MRTGMALQALLWRCQLRMVVVAIISVPVAQGRMQLGSLYEQKDLSLRSQSGLFDAQLDVALEPEEAAMHASVSASALAEDVRELGTLLQDEMSRHANKQQDDDVQRAVQRSAQAADILARELQTLRQTVAAASGLGLSQVSAALAPGVLVDEYNEDTVSGFLRAQNGLSQQMLQRGDNDTTTGNESSNGTDDEEEEEADDEQGIVQKIMTINGAVGQVVGMVLAAGAGLLLLLCCVGICLVARR
mmetsp:Transcript_26845/g.61908  ORF Transcript_26845/g.61908 Transcript_26845/m.61908 type:complete len:245 (-) Transcript_26845:34-768(-)